MSTNVKKYRFDLKTTFPGRVSIIGAARSGIAAAAFFHAKKVALFISDSCPEEKLVKILADKGLSAVSHEAGGHSDRVLDADLIILSPGVPSDLPVLRDARVRGIPVWSEMELGYRASNATFLAVTGSTGKSTTVSFLGEALKAGGKNAVVAGNIGVPVISVVADLPREAWVVAEVSSFQLENIEEFRPLGAAVLNLMKNHLDRYASENDYYAAKYEIARNLTKDNYLVANLHDEKIVHWTESMRKRTNVIFFGSQPGKGDAFWYDEGMGKIRYRFGGMQGSILDVKDMRIGGRHNFENACAAAALAKIAGVDDRAIGNGIASFGGLPHRLEFSGEVDGVRYYNDSKSTTAESVICAVSAFGPQTVHLIAGGRDKGCDFRAVVPAIKKQVKDICLIGEAAMRIESEWRGLAPIFRAATLEQAVAIAASLAAPGDAVVFSPGCSSFDMFVNYEERGRIFRQIVTQRKTERISG
jgi:UDP-N-acetylmuramoylalanine--D-glutamate ligase